MIFEPFDVVAVPFPFTDSARRKRRPALVLSSASFNREVRHCVMAMITSTENAHWLHDVPITDLASAGLPSESVVRMKLFTLDNRFVIRKVGSLADEDREELLASLSRIFPTVREGGI